MLVEPSRISYIESDRRKVRIHAGAEEIEAYASLSDLAAELPASFIQCHKSFLVNMDHVKELKADSVVLSSNQVVPVSQKRRKFVREAVFSLRAIQAVGRRDSRMPELCLDIIGVVPVQLCSPMRSPRCSIFAGSPCSGCWNLFSLRLFSSFRFKHERRVQIGGLRAARPHSHIPIAGKPRAQDSRRDAGASGAFLRGAARAAPCGCR